MAISFVQARAFGVEVDQAFQRHEQLQFADHGGRGGRRLAGQRFDAVEAAQEAQLRVEAGDARGIVGIAAANQQRHLLARRHAEFAADAAQRGDHRLQPLDVGLGPWA